MLDEFKRAYKLVQYGLSIKLQLVFAIVFTLIGIAVEIASRGTQFIGAFYIILSGLFLFQLVISVDNSALVQSSPYKRKIMVVYPYVVIIPLTYLLMAVLSVIHWRFAVTGSAEDYSNQARMMFILGVVLFLTNLFFGVCYKYFLLATMLLFVFMIPVISLLQYDRFPIYQWSGVSFSRSVICAFVFITIGLVISYLLTNLLYRKPLSSMAFRGILGKNGRKG